MQFQWNNFNNCSLSKWLNLLEEMGYRKRHANHTSMWFNPVCTTVDTKFESVTCACANEQDGDLGCAHLPKYAHVSRRSRVDTEGPVDGCKFLRVGLPSVGAGALSSGMRTLTNRLRALLDDLRWVARMICEYAFSELWEPNLNIYASPFHPSGIRVFEWESE